MQVIYILYQYLIALPILMVLTILTAIITIICFPWKNAWWLHSVQAVWARCFCYLLFIPVRVSGKEHVMKGQSYVFVSNHQSMYDVFAIYGWLPSVFKWLMKAEIRKIPFVGTACKMAGHIYIDRRHAKSAIESLDEVKKALTGGVSTVIFPEGTRTKTGEMGGFKRGAFQIAAELNLPIIPISLTGCWQVLKPCAKYITRHSIQMHIGEPIMLHELEGQDAITYVQNKVKEGMQV